MCEKAFEMEVQWNSLLWVECEHVLSVEVQGASVKSFWWLGNVSVEPVL